MMTPETDALETGPVEAAAVNGKVDAAETESDPEPEPREIRDSVVGSLAAERAAVSDALVGAMAAEQIEAHDSLILFGSAGRIEGQNVRILLGPASAAALGAALGLSLLLLRRLLGGRS